MEEVFRLRLISILRVIFITVIVFLLSPLNITAAAAADLPTHSIDFKKSYLMCNPVNDVAAATGKKATAVTQEDINAFMLQKVAPYADLDNAQLQSLITLEGGKGINKELRTIAYYFACLYQQTNNQLYAKKTILLLSRFAEVMSQWPMVNKDGVTTTPRNNIDWNKWDNGGIWGGWYYVDFGEGHPLLFAYHLVREQLDETTNEFIRENVLREQVEFTWNQYEGKEFSNLAGYRMVALIPYGILFDAEYIHRVVKWNRQMTGVGYFRDGMWHEGSPSYHDQMTGQLLLIPELLQGYSDPPSFSAKDGTRYDNLNVKEGLEDRYERIKKAIDYFVLPNDYFLAVHDSAFTKRAWFIERTASEPHLFPGARHAILGAGENNDRTEVHLEFSGTEGHEHLDALSIVLWALGGELLGETDYNGVSSTIDWNKATAAHNTVVVDGQNQQDRWGDAFALTENDKIDSIGEDEEPGFHYIQQHGQGNTKNYGNLKLWDPEQQVVEVDGGWSYPEGKMELYSRLVSLVPLDETNNYVVDIFRVKGGQIQDWMLHGRLEEKPNYNLTTNLELVPANEVRYNYLTVNQQAVTSDQWYSEFSIAAGKVRTIMLGYPKTEISIGSAPAIRKAGSEQFLDVRRAGGDNLFAAIHEPYLTAPKIKSITPLQYTGEADSMVAFKVELVNGRVDYIASTLDEEPYPLRKIPGTNIVFKGRYVKISLENNLPTVSYLLSGSGLCINNQPLISSAGDFSYSGTIDYIYRQEKGDLDNAFITSSFLPVGEQLSWQTVVLTLNDGTTEAYTINNIESIENDYLIKVNEEPGLELRSGIAKYVYYPWFGIPGEIEFSILGGAVKDEGKIFSTADLDLELGACEEFTCSDQGCLDEVNKNKQFCHWEASEDVIVGTDSVCAQRVTEAGYTIGSVLIKNGYNCAGVHKGVPIVQRKGKTDYYVLARKFSEKYTGTPYGNIVELKHLNTDDSTSAFAPWCTVLTLEDAYQCIDDNTASPNLHPYFDLYSGKYCGFFEDKDGDYVSDGRDNCPTKANPLQEDADLDGRGDLCEVELCFNTLDDDSDGQTDCGDGDCEASCARMEMSKK